MKAIKVFLHFFLGALIGVIWPGLISHSLPIIGTWQYQLTFYSMAFVGLGFMVYSFYQAYSFFIKPMFNKAKA